MKIHRHSLPVLKESLATLVEKSLEKKLFQGRNNEDEAGRKNELSGKSMTMLKGIVMVLGYLFDPEHEYMNGMIVFFIKYACKLRN